MKFFMAFMFSIIPAIIVGTLLWFVMGIFGVLAGWAVFGLGMEICLSGTEE